jgi:uncharacterized protein YndB with AHSA1/START domain
MKNENPTYNGKVLTIVREFDAPRNEVFNAFANADALNEWWGPVETKNSVIKLEFKPGGIFHFKMDYQGKISYGRFLFRRIEPYNLLEFTNAFSDEHANVIKAPFDIQLPAEILYQLCFTETNNKTILTLTGQPINGTPEEEEGFDSINASMHQGFGATFDQLAAYLTKIQANFKTS